MHKTASELKPQDQFLMAGGHYKVVNVYGTETFEMVKVAFVPVNTELVSGRFTLTINSSVLFSLI